MGIKMFFSWFRRNFKSSINGIKNNDDNSIYQFDNIIIDLNGPIHTATQKAFNYGAFAKPESLLKPSFLKIKNKVSDNGLDYNNVYLYLTEYLEETISNLNPQKRIVICIDGVAPFSKICQQRKRRYIKAKNNDTCEFDSNCITPGTEFMNNLKLFMEFHIQSKLNSGEWNFEVIFSSDMSYGEGEHKGLTYIRDYGSNNESYVICGSDADLIMLALATDKENIYIYRDDISQCYNYLLINIGLTRNILTHLMDWDDYSNHEFNHEQAIIDFVFMMFTSGNDFLPHIPSIEIIENGIEILINIYKTIGKKYGHLLLSNTTLNLECFKEFLYEIGKTEEDMFINKIQYSNFFEDKTLEKAINEDQEFDIEIWSNEYMKRFNTVNIENLSHEYFNGMMWVIKYYTSGCPDWMFHYKNHYCPPASILCKFVDSYKQMSYKKNKPILPFQQLLCVLPPKSSQLLPMPLSDIITSGPLNKYCPIDFKIDLSGFKHEYEGIALLPFISHRSVEREYNKVKSLLKSFDLRRNKFIDSTVYNYDEMFQESYKNKFGYIETNNVRKSHIKL